MRSGMYLKSPRNGGGSHSNVPVLKNTEFWTFTKYMQAPGQWLASIAVSVMV